MSLCITGPREQSQQRHNAPLFDGILHRSTTVNGGHKTNATETHLKNMIANAKNPLTAKFWTREHRAFQDSCDRDRVTMHVSTRMLKLTLPPAVFIAYHFPR